MEKYVIGKQVAESYENKKSYVYVRDNEYTIFKIEITDELYEKSFEKRIYNGDIVKLEIENNIAISYDKFVLNERND